MANFIRAYKNGGTFFFTAVTKNREPILIDNIQHLRESVRKTKTKYPFDIVCWVVLPDHMHCIWQLPNDSDYRRRWVSIKSNFTQLLNAKTGSVWQPKYWEHLVKDEKDLENHINYSYYNPVKHGYVKKVTEWPYSSIHRDIKRGLFPSNWGDAGVNVEEGHFGE